MIIKKRSESNPIRMHMEELGSSEGFAVSGGFSTPATRVGAKCGRWNPTVEQVKVLTDLFRSGLRTPSTEQIQMISSQLSAFGKIESKNVFYWFQNHKARERHHKKRRRQGPQEDQGGAVAGAGRIATDQQLQKARSRSMLCSLASCTKLHEESRGESRHEIIRSENMNNNISETLELFPLKSYGLEDQEQEQEQEQEKVRSIGSSSHGFCKGGGLFEAALDLRLSFC